MQLALLHLWLVFVSDHSGPFRPQAGSAALPVSSNTVAGESQLLSSGPREPARAAHPSRGLRAGGLSAYGQADCVKRIASKRGLRAADVVLPAEVYETDRGAAFVLARAGPLAEPLRAARRAVELEAR